jgi:hypothetical protein
MMMKKTLTLVVAIAAAVALAGCATGGAAAVAVGRAALCAHPDSVRVKVIAAVVDQVGKKKRPAKAGTP